MHNSNLLKHMKKKMEGQKVFQLTNWTHIDIPSGTFHKKSVYIGALSRRSLHFLFVFLCNFTGQRHFIQRQFIFTGCTGKSLSEALLFAEHGKNMLCTKIGLNVRNNFCTQHVLPRFELWIFMYWTCNSMNNLSYCGLVDAKIRASDKDLPAHKDQKSPS